MRGKIRSFLLLLALIMGLTIMSQNVFAAGTWKSSNGNYYYYLENNTPVTGWTKIDGNYFYFDGSGALVHNGWYSIGKSLYYLSPTGSVGTLGVAYIGLQKVKDSYYLFNETGKIVTGWVSYEGQRFYFSTSSKVGTRGKSVTGWKTLKGNKYYFRADNGALVTSNWIDNTYYVDENGRMMKNAITPDLYYVGSNGTRQTTAKGWLKLNGNYYYLRAGKAVTGWQTINKKVRYFNEKGERQKGWLTLDGKTYYLKSGVMQTGTLTISGKTYTFGSDGVLQTGSTEITPPSGGNSSGKKSVLVLAGHGQGDSGATSTWGQEQNLTREFAALIVAQLRSSGKVNVTYYKEGSLNYDCYQQNAATFGSTGLNLSSKLTGEGKIRDKVVAGLKSNPNLPDFTQYDYVLEVHFNAKTNKDPKGDGNFTGVGFYVNNHNNTIALERNIVNRIVQLGFAAWAGGVLTSDTLFNARVCQELGVDYGLLETAFIDDGDDMKFYNENKTKMAKAAAEAIDAYFS